LYRHDENNIAKLHNVCSSDVAFPEKYFPENSEEPEKYV